MLPLHNSASFRCIGPVTIAKLCRKVGKSDFFPTSDSHNSSRVTTTANVK